MTAAVQLLGVAPVQFGSSIAPKRRDIAGRREIFQLLQSPPGFSPIVRQRRNVADADPCPMVVHTSRDLSKFRERLAEVTFVRIRPAKEAVR